MNSTVPQYNGKFWINVPFTDDSDSDDDDEEKTEVEAHLVEIIGDTDDGKNVTVRYIHWENKDDNTESIPKTLHPTLSCLEERFEKELSEAQRAFDKKTTLAIDFAATGIYEVVITKIKTEDDGVHVYVYFMDDQTKGAYHWRQFKLCRMKALATTGSTCVDKRKVKKMKNKYEFVDPKDFTTTFTTSSSLALEVEEEEEEEEEDEKEDVEAEDEKKEEEEEEEDSNILTKRDTQHFNKWMGVCTKSKKKFEDWATFYQSFGRAPKLSSVNFEEDALFHFRDNSLNRPSVNFASTSFSRNKQSCESFRKAITEYLGSEDMYSSFMGSEDEDVIMATPLSDSHSNKKKRKSGARSDSGEKKVKKAKTKKKEKQKNTSIMGVIPSKVRRLIHNYFFFKTS